MTSMGQVGNAVRRRLAKGAENHHGTRGSCDGHAQQGRGFNPCSPQAPPFRAARIARSQTRSACCAAPGQAGRQLDGNGWNSATARRAGVAPPAAPFRRRPSRWWAWSRRCRDKRLLERGEQGVHRLAILPDMIQFIAPHSSAQRLFGCTQFFRQCHNGVDVHVCAPSFR